MARGRKRKNAPRVNGRVKQKPRTERREDLQSVVREARERVLALTAAAATRLPETTELGRLLATGEISQRQYDAGDDYAKAVRAHDSLLGVRGYPRAGDLDRAGGGHQSTEESDEERAGYRRAMSKYDRSRSALREACREDRMASAVVDAVCVNGWELPDLVPSLRVGLNHLARLSTSAPRALDTSRELVQSK